MGKVIVQDYTYKKPITMIGVEAGICWGANTSNDEKNYLRGIDCLESGHGRTFEFPDVYLTLEGYSARVIREWYTHIGGLPTRLQASTRYIDYEHGFGYVTPPSIEGNPEAKEVYEDLMEHIKSYLESLDTIGVPREDSALGLPLGMETKIVCKQGAIQRRMRCFGELFGGMEIHRRPLLHAQMQAHGFLLREKDLRYDAAQTMNGALSVAVVILAAVLLFGNDDNRPRPA